MFKKIKEGSLKGLGKVGKVVDVIMPLAEVITDAIVGDRPPKPSWGGSSETGDSFTQLMNARFNSPSGKNADLTKTLCKMQDNGEIDAQQYEQLFNKYRK
jgi:hypothetical protein